VPITEDVTWVLIMAVLVGLVWVCIAILSEGDLRRFPRR
jgi:hypothetical protein